MTYEEKATLIANAHWQGGKVYAAAVLREAVAEETTLLCATLADIRIATGVNEKPMLGELAGAIEVRMGQGWQPIETAPRDGESIMVWSPMFGGQPVIAKWDADTYAKRPIPRFITYDRTHGARDLCCVAYWQPLPSPPQNGEK